MAGFTKLHGSIIHSSVWQTPYHVRVVWITMLAMADANGLVEASIGGLAKEASVKRPECLEALESFLSPDPDSRTPDFEGRRIEEVQGGWLLINHAQYRDRQTDAQVKAAERARKYRERRRAKLSNDESRPIETASRNVTPVTDYPLEEEAEEEADQSRRRCREKSAPRKRAAPSRPPPEPIQIAQNLYDAIRSHSPDFMAKADRAATERKLLGWARDIWKAMRLDGMDTEGARMAIDEAHRSDDPFWRANLQSGASLRKQYEKLRTKAAQRNKAAKDPNVFRPGEVDYAAFGKMMNLGKTT